MYNGFKQPSTFYPRERVTRGGSLSLEKELEFHKSQNEVIEKKKVKLTAEQRFLFNELQSIYKDFASNCSVDQYNQKESFGFVFSDGFDLDSARKREEKYREILAKIEATFSSYSDYQDYFVDYIVELQREITLESERKIFEIGIDRLAASLLESYEKDGKLPTSIIYVDTGARPLAYVLRSFLEKIYCFVGQSLPQQFFVSESGVTYSNEDEEEKEKIYFKKYIVGDDKNSISLRKDIDKLFGKFQMERDILSRNIKKEKIGSDEYLRLSEKLSESWRYLVWRNRINRLEEEYANGGVTREMIKDLLKEADSLNNKDESLYGGKNIAYRLISEYLEDIKHKLEVVDYSEKINTHGVDGLSDDRIKEVVSYHEQNPGSLFVIDDVLCEGRSLGRMNKKLRSLGVDNLYVFCFMVQNAQRSFPNLGIPLDHFSGAIMGYPYGEKKQNVIPEIFPGSEKMVASGQIDKDVLADYTWRRIMSRIGCVGGYLPKITSFNVDGFSYQNYNPKEANPKGVRKDFPYSMREDFSYSYEEMRKLRDRYLDIGDEIVNGMDLKKKISSADKSGDRWFS